MSKSKTGLANSISGTSPSLNNNNSQFQINDLKGQIVAARVTDIVLDENHPKFKDVGRWNGIGAIFYEFVNKIGSANGVSYALPYDSQIKTYPLINEIVLLFSLPNQLMGINTTSESYFYLPPLGIWNHPHHNAYPNLVNTNKKSQSRDYKSTENGVVRRVKDKSTEIDLNSPTNPSQNTFEEEANIHPLMPFMGDSLLEGRHGQSIRFGSTARPSANSQSLLINNNWSTTGKNGNPITILRNGQPEKVSDRGWIPITEDINKDLSSIYLTSYQKLPFSIANENFASYSQNTSPEKPALYTNPQIILNSDRIILNAKNDSILISGQNSVGISSNKSINIESTSEMNLSSKLVRLGGVKANQSVLRGDETVGYLKILITELQNLAEALKVVQDWPGGAPTPNPSILLTANCALQVFENVYNEIDSIKSKTVKTL
jgi:hypothetical protein